jgi:MFS family permease
MLTLVLRTPGVPRLFGASLVGRIPAGALGLLLILRTRELGGSYALGGAAAGALAAGMALGAPLLGRTVDVRGQTGVLAAGAGLSAGALLGLALLPAGAPGALVVALAGAAGLAHPPLSACLRALWPRLLPDPSRQHAAYALESAALEITYIVGPLVVVGVVASRSPALALGLCAALLGAGTLAFAAHPVSRGWAPVTGVVRGRAGALRSPGVRTLLVAQACLGLSFGAIEVSVVAFAEQGGAVSATGPLLAAWGLASLVGGLVAARRGAPADPVRRLVALLAALAAADALLLAAPGPAGLAPLLVVAGLAIAPLFAVVYGLAGDVARAGTATEAFTWLTTGIAVGLAAGSTAGGAIAQHWAGGGFAAAAAAAAVAALVARAGAGTLTRS